MSKTLRSAMLLCATAAGAQTIVPITSESSHHLAISNQYIRAFKVEVAPHAETRYHQHDYDYVYVAIGDADVNSVRIHEKPVNVKLKDGQVEFSKGPFAHKAQNNGDQPFRNITVELLKGVGSPICGIAGGAKSCGEPIRWAGGVAGQQTNWGESNPVLRSSRVRIQSYKTQGGFVIPGFESEGNVTMIPAYGGQEERLPRHFLLVAVRPLSLKLVSQKGTREISAQAGDMFWNDATEARLLIRSREARFVIIGFPDQKTQ